MAYHLTSHVKHINKKNQANWAITFSLALTILLWLNLVTFFFFFCETTILVTVLHIRAWTHENSYVEVTLTIKVESFQIKTYDSIIMNIISYITLFKIHLNFFFKCFFFLVNNFFLKMLHPPHIKNLIIELLNVISLRANVFIFQKIASPLIIHIF